MRIKINITELGNYQIKNELIVFVRCTKTRSGTLDIYYIYPNNYVPIFLN